MEGIWHHLGTLLTSFAASSIVVVSATIHFSSSPKLDGLFIDLRGSPLVLMTGAMIAGVHGLVLGCFSLWQNTALLSRSLIASILAMEIVSLLICVLVAIICWPVNLGARSGPKKKTLSDYVYFLLFLVMAFLYVSAFLLAPALVVGLVNWLLTVLFR